MIFSVLTLKKLHIYRLKAYKSQIFTKRQDFNESFGLIEILAFCEIILL